MKSLQKSVPYLYHKDIKSGTWAAGNTLTVSDKNVRDNSLIVIEHTSAYNGRWRISTKTAGASFVITSSDAESQGTTFNYEIL